MRWWFGRKFRRGDRVVYVNKILDPDCVGVQGEVCNWWTWDRVIKQYVYGVAYDDGEYSHTRQSSLKRLKVSRFERSLRAYIAAEKQALGIDQ
jgi:hypothetical protein